MLHRLLPLLACMLAAAGCASEPNMVPAPGANLAPGLERGAVARENGVRLQAQADVWPGRAPITREVTPVRVSITNGSDVPIRVRYEDFALETARRGYSALPPLRLTGSVGETVLRSPYDPVTDPVFGAVGFDLAPAYASVYPGYPLAVADPFPYEPLWTEDRYRRTRDYELPTKAMVDLAIPEGVLRSGGRMTGFLYFENIPAGVGRTVFRMDLVNARTGEQIDTIQIPFRTAGA